MTKLYTVENVCNYFNVSRNTVYALIQQRILKTKKVGRAYKITENALADLIKYLES